jgi:hypothetical protein
MVPIVLYPLTLYLFNYISFRYNDTTVRKACQVARDHRIEYNRFREGVENAPCIASMLSCGIMSPMLPRVRPHARFPAKVGLR